MTSGPDDFEQLRADALRLSVVINEVVQGRMDVPGFVGGYAEYRDNAVELTAGHSSIAVERDLATGAMAVSYMEAETPTETGFLGVVHTYRFGGNAPATVEAVRHQYIHTLGRPIAAREPGEPISLRPLDILDCFELSTAMNQLSESATPHRSPLARFAGFLGRLISK